MSGPSLEIRTLDYDTLGHLQGLEHVCEWLQAYQEVADNHRRTEMCPVMEGLLLNAHQTLVARLSSFSASSSEGPHRQCQTVNPMRIVLHDRVSSLTLGTYPEKTSRGQVKCSHSIPKLRGVSHWKPLKIVSTHGIRGTVWRHLVFALTLGSVC